MPSLADSDIFDFHLTAVFAENIVSFRNFIRPKSHRIKEKQMDHGKGDDEIQENEKNNSTKNSMRKLASRKNHKANEKLIECAKPHKCKQCGKCFKSLYLLKNHAIIHTGIKPYKCDHCGKSFSRSESLKAHVQTHKGEKPFECDHCKRTFGTKKIVKSHLRIHTGEKPYKCKECDKCFRTSQILKTHGRIHTKEKTIQMSYLP